MTIKGHFCDTDFASIQCFCLNLSPISPYEKEIYFTLVKAITFIFLIPCNFYAKSDVLLSYKHLFRDHHQ
jgi:hypothetical protein